MVARNSHFNSKSGNRRCPGPVGRRELLKLGWRGFSSLSIPLLLKLRSTAAAPPSTSPTSIILVWLRGGGSHLDTFDPKPQSASEYRGPYQTIQTRTEDLHITELLPRLAQISNRYTLLRSMAHTGGGHPSGSLQVLSGDKDRQDKPRPVLPDFMSVAHYLRNDPSRNIPNYIGVNAVDYSGYPDCRPEFIEAFESLGRLATKTGVEGRPIEIRAPLMHRTKAEIIRRGHELGVDYSQTISCYQADEHGRACGVCDACRLRAAGFAEAGVPDPTSYIG